MLKEWKRYEAAPEAKKLARELDVTELTAQALWHRGFRTPEEAQEFLHPEEMPKDYHAADFYITGEIALGLLKTLIKLLPYLGLLAQYGERLEGLTAAMNKEVVKPVANKAADFEDAMKKFFDKNHI